MLAALAPILVILVPPIYAVASYITRGSDFGCLEHYLFSIIRIRKESRHKTIHSEELPPQNVITRRKFIYACVNSERAKNSPRSTTEEGKKKKNIADRLQGIHQARLPDSLDPSNLYHQLIPTSAY